MTLELKHYIPVPGVYDEAHLSEDNAQEVVEWLAERRIGVATVTEDGVQWQHVMQGAQKADFGQYIVVMRDGLAQVYSEPLSAMRNNQEVAVGEQGLVSLNTTPV